MIKLRKLAHTITSSLKTADSFCCSFVAQSELRGNNWLIRVCGTNNGEFELKLWNEFGMLIFLRITRKRCDCEIWSYFTRRTFHFDSLLMQFIFTHLSQNSVKKFYVAWIWGKKSPQFYIFLFMFQLNPRKYVP